MIAMYLRLVVIVFVGAAVMASAWGEVVDLPYPEDAIIINFDYVTVERTEYVPRFEDAVHEGLSVEGFIGPTHAIYPGDGEFYTMEGSGMRRFTVGADGEIRLVENIPGVPLADTHSNADAYSSSDARMDFNAFSRRYLWSDASGRNNHQYFSTHKTNRPALFELTDDETVGFRYTHSITARFAGRGWEGERRFWIGLGTDLSGPQWSDEFAIVRCSTGFAFVDVNTTALLSDVSLGGQPTLPVIGGRTLYFEVRYPVQIGVNAPPRVKRFVALDLSDPRNPVVASYVPMDFAVDPEEPDSENGPWTISRYIADENRLYVFMYQGVVDKGSPWRVVVLDTHDGYDLEILSHHDFETNSAHGISEGRVRALPGLVTLDSGIAFSEDDGVVVMEFDSVTGELVREFQIPIGLGTPYTGRGVRDLCLVDGQLMTLFEVDDDDSSVPTSIPTFREYRGPFDRWQPGQEEYGDGVTMLARYDISGDEPVLTWDRLTGSAKHFVGDHAWQPFGRRVIAANVADPSNPTYDIHVPTEGFTVPEIGLTFGLDAVHEYSFGTTFGLGEPTTGYVMTSAIDPTDTDVFRVEL